jgi:hypothetical protein
METRGSSTTRLESTLAKQPFPMTGGPTEPDLVEFSICGHVTHLGSRRNRSLIGAVETGKLPTMVDDQPDELRSLAADLEADAEEFEPQTEHEAGVVEGLGRAVGRVKARAADVAEPN